MGHIDETSRGIGKVAPQPGLVQVEENVVMVLRSAWGSNPFSRTMTDSERREAMLRLRPGMPIPQRLFDGYVVKREGWRLFIPGLIHDFVAMVSLAPRQEDVAPMPVNVANGQAVDFNIRFSTVVGEVNWTYWRLPLVNARGERLEDRQPAYADRVREARRRGEDHILVLDPNDPFDKDQPYRTNDAAIIRASLRPENIWQEASTAIGSALNEAAQVLGVGSVEPLRVADWLNQPVARRAGHRLPVRRQAETNRSELMEQIMVMANQSLHRFGIVIFDVRLEGIELPEALRKAVEQRQSAGVLREAARDRSAAMQEQLAAAGMGALPANAGPLDRAAQAFVVTRVIESQDAQAGVPSNRTPLIQVGDVGSGNAIGGPAGGSSKGGSGGKSGGAGAPKKR